MSNVNLVSESLEALLVSIAEGVREAQDALNSSPPVDTFGRPMPTYHLPYLDFEVKVGVETVKRTGKPDFTRMIPLGLKNTPSVDIGSTLSGRLVAIPPGEGLPIPVLTVESKRVQSRKHLIKVTAVNSSGEILGGQKIELNINMEASRALSAVEGVNLVSQRAGTKLTDMVLITDEKGEAETSFKVDTGISAKALFVITAELGIERVNITVQAGGRG